MLEQIANRFWTKHEFKVNDLAFHICQNRADKLELTKTGPFKIIQVHANNTVSIQKGLEVHRINIRQLEPFKPTNAPEIPWCGRMSQSSRLVRFATIFLSLNLSFISNSSLLSHSR